MYLKSLHIHGFKSFADKTVIEFDKGVTGIVGPNGCGKSNVVDAIRWVLGETSAKALRGGEMADVIFNGTEKRKAHGMAEVTLTMSDCEETLGVDYNEVAITRRVFKDGKSEYRLNGTICRLRDINDLFMDTGIGRTAYSIMEQGKIDMLLSSKPEDRRQVFEEAAGITKFKKEKKEAIRKLDYTQANLLRVSDVLAEQERRMNSLKRQVAKARRFKSLANDVKVLDTHLSHKRYVELSAELQELKNSIRSLSARELEIERNMPEKDRAVGLARENARKLEDELTEIRQQLNEKRNAGNSAESRIAFNNERQAELLNRIEQNENDIQETRNKLEEQEGDLEVAAQTLEELQQRISTQTEELNIYESRVQNSKSERLEIESKLRDARSESNKTQSLIAASQAKLESSLAQMEGNRERARQLEEEEAKLSIDFQQAESEKQQVAELVEGRAAHISGLLEESEEAERQFQATRVELNSAREEAATSHKEFTRVSSRLEVLKQLTASGEGFEQGTQAVLKGLDDPSLYESGVHGVLANFIQVDNDFAVSVEGALGTHLQAVLVKNAILAESIIDTLTEKKMGAAAVIPEDFVPFEVSTQIINLPEGAVAWALDHVKSDKMIAPLVDSLLEKVCIVEDLATALKLRKDYPELTFATKLGAILSAEGIVTGGESEGGNSSVFERQNEVRSLEEECSELQSKEETAKEKLVSLEGRIDEQRKASEAARELLQQARVEESTLQGQLRLATREVESYESKCSSVKWEREELQKREDVVGDNRNQMEGDLQIARVRLEELENEQIAVSRELEESMNREQQSSEVLHELRTNLAVERRALQAAEEQKRPMAARLDELRSLTVRRESEIITFRERVEEALGESGGLLEVIETSKIAAEQLEQELEGVSTKRSGVIEAIEKAEEELGLIRRQMSQVTDQKGKEEIKSTKIELRLESVTESVMERYQLDISMFRPNSHALLGCIADQKKKRSNTSGLDVSDEASDSAVESSSEAKISSELTEEEIAAVQIPGEDGPDWKFVEAEVSELKRKLDAMGPVNVDAIEEFEELEERHLFVKSQHDDLVNSRDELINVIERINVETEVRFSETFAQVSANFREMFKLLFGEKGKADLILVDADNPLESGIEVVARPPGKKLQSITLLSGGERAMTAVALLFSIYQIKPSPFCVLDELDAPLDEANIGRFLKVLEKFIDRSQFIIVTHHKRTMRSADIIYGVTMEEFGVSKPVGMRLTANGDDITKNNEPKSAAQKAALKLDSE